MMFSSRAQMRWLAAVLLLVFAGVGALSFDRARRARYDFHHFYLDARYVWEHGELNPNTAHPVTADDQRQLPFYLPAVSLVLSPVTAFGHKPAAALWSLMQVLALAASLHVLWAWMVEKSPEKPPVGVFVIALAASVPVLYEAARFNQVSFFVLALVLSGYHLLGRRGWVAGFLFGAAAVLKLLPAIFLPWLILKRKWSAVGGFVFGAAILAIVPCVVCFGVEDTVTYHQQWWEYNVHGDSAGGLLNADLPDHFVDRRNQSIIQVLARLTWAEHPRAMAWQPTQLTPGTSKLIGYGVMAGMLGALLIITHRAWSRIGADRRQAELAVFAMGMLVFSPLFRQYYLVWGLPAVALLTWFGMRGRTLRARAIGTVGFWVWILGMAVWPFEVARTAGSHLVMLVIVGMLLLIVTRETNPPPRSENAEP